MTQTAPTKTAPTSKASTHTKPASARKGWFTCFALATSNWAGSQSAFLLAFGSVIVWAATGPVFRYSETWQMVINTGTTIVTFLMVFLIQNSQNRESKVVQLKLDELIRAVEGAENALINMEEMTEDELEATHAKFIHLAETASKVKGGRTKAAQSRPGAGRAAQSHAAG